MVKELFTSKKFIATLVGVVSVVLMTYFGVSKDMVDKIKELVMVYVMGQGVADAGKYFNK